MDYWVSCNLFTVLVEVDEDTNRITHAAPILRKFRGRNFGDLLSWALKHGELRVEKLPPGRSKVLRQSQAMGEVE